ncbi:hypothetical protein [Streptomyces hokutonensis]|uniref:hypothetical protein n=1 Tax=Streptomyces hokutonensis TaxID=1306990 RepID=UPI00380C6890
MKGPGWLGWFHLPAGRLGIVAGTAMAATVLWAAVPARIVAAARSCGPSPRTHETA